MNTAQNAAMKWIKLKVSNQKFYFTINEGDAGDVARKLQCVNNNKKRINLANCVA
jgi:hypothetical protein